ncbi:hypothetical protein M405DRAFT_823244 [Rhizopogon salebrosus TDB-379]|nr:hypothetical protein M405DRAFT_823244 [Rhizopogon salebrosus TDB-379]
MFELIATGSSPLSRVHNDLALSPLSNSLPTAVAFAKARAERFFRLSSDANERPRGHMQRQVKMSTLSGGLVLADMPTRTSSELLAWGRIRTTGARRLALDTFRSKAQHCKNVLLAKH